MRRGLTKYGDEAFSLFLRKAFIKAMGYSDEALERPIVGIANTGSGYNPCHRTMPELIEAVRRGVMLAGGLAIDFPTISLHESFAQPTSMLYRNLMSMDTEEMIDAQPMDAVVLIGGCDKTVPAQLMGAASASVPAIQVVTGPMMTGSHRGERLGACTDCRRLWGLHRAGEIDAAEIDQILQAHDRVTLVPDRENIGTNCLIMSPADSIAFIFDGRSFKPHVDAAFAAGITPAIRPSRGFALDIDTADDLKALLAQAPSTQTATFLVKSGIARRLQASDNVQPDAGVSDAS